MTDFQRATGFTSLPEEGEGLRWCLIDAVIVKQVRAHLGDGAAARIVYEAFCSQAGINPPRDICQMTHERALSRALAEDGRAKAKDIDDMEGLIGDAIAAGLIASSDNDIVAQREVR